MKETELLKKIIIKIFFLQDKNNTEISPQYLMELFYEIMEFANLKDDNKRKFLESFPKELEDIIRTNDWINNH